MPKRHLIHADRPRLLRLHERISGLIPCCPEDVRADLRVMDLRKLLSVYINWADRFIAPRPRRVVTWDGFLRHGTAAPHMDAVRALGERIERGNDLKPWLSDHISRFGYVRRKTRSKGIKSPGIEKDKDYALNAYDTHHLHLSTAVQPNGWVKRTRALLYACFSRDRAFLVMVGDHNSFDDGSLAKALARLV